MTKPSETAATQAIESAKHPSIIIVKIPISQIGTGVSDNQILRELHRVYDFLANSQADLDPDSKDVLYGNLWDLYI